MPAAGPPMPTRCKAGAVLAHTVVAIGWDSTLKNNALAVLNTCFAKSLPFIASNRAACFRACVISLRGYFSRVTPLAGSSGGATAGCRPAVACSVTGVGEHVMRALLARDCAQRMLDRDVSVADACSRAIEEGILKARPGGRWHHGNTLSCAAHCADKCQAACPYCNTRGRALIA